MDETTQHNAALVEETNAAIAQTESRAQELDRIVEVFKLGDAVTAGSEAELDAGFAETTATARASGF